MITYLSAASALFLSALIIVAIARQKTHRVFQKHILLMAIYLLVCAIISNVLISVWIVAGSQPSPTDGVILSKRVQATFDYLFGIAIGAFIFVATTPTIGSRKDFVDYMKTEFPNSYVSYLFHWAFTIVTTLFAKWTVDPIDPNKIQFEGTSCSSTAPRSSPSSSTRPTGSSPTSGRRSRARRSGGTRT